MIGVVKDKNCVYASSFAAWAMKGPDTVSGVPVAAKKYEVLMAGKGVKWVNSLGTIPQRALALGYKSSSFHISGRKIGQKTALASIYACRTTTHEGLSTIGWTSNGNECTYLDQGKVTTSDESIGAADEALEKSRGMQLLVRDAGQVVHLDLAEKP